MKWVKLSPQQHNEQLSRFFTGHTDRLTGRNLESAHLCLQPWANAPPRRLPVWGQGEPIEGWEELSDRLTPVDCCRRYTTWFPGDYEPNQCKKSLPFSRNQCKAIDVLGLNLLKSTHHFRLVLLLCVILQPGKSLECLSTWFPWYGAAPLDSTKASSTPLNLKPWNPFEPCYSLQAFEEPDTKVTRIFRGAFFFLVGAWKFFVSEGRGHWYEQPPVAVQQKKSWTSLSTSFAFLVGFVWKQGIFSQN